MEEYWTRFKTWLRANAPHLLLRINEGATQDDINTLQSLIGRPVPQDFVEFYKIHNGQKEEYGFEGLLYSDRLLPLHDITRTWKAGTMLSILGAYLRPALRRRIV